MSGTTFLVATLNRKHNVGVFGEYICVTREMGGRVYDT